MAHPEFQFPFDALFILPLLEHRNTKCKVAVHMESKYISKAVTFLGLFFFFHSFFVQFRILAPRARPVYFQSFFFFAQAADHERVAKVSHNFYRGVIRLMWTWAPPVLEEAF